MTKKQGNGDNFLNVVSSRRCMALFLTQDTMLIIGLKNNQLKGFVYKKSEKAEVKI